MLVLCLQLVVLIPSAPTHTKRKTIRKCRLQYRPNLFLNQGTSANTTPKQCDNTDNLTDYALTIDSI